MYIQCDGFILRALKSGDEDNIVKYANNKNIAMNLRDVFPHPYTRKDAEWIIAQHGKTSASRYAIDINGELIGVVGIHPGHDVERIGAELGYWLAEPFWGRGIMPKAVKAVVKYAFEIDKELMRIYAGVFDRNTASMRVLEKAGFIKEGILRKAYIKDGVIMDSHLYSMIREDMLNNKL